MAPVPNDVIAALRRLYASSTDAETFFEHLAYRTNDFRETKVRVIAAATKLKRQPVVWIFRALKEAGVGDLIVGRKGNETRFRWNFKMTEVGQAAIGELDAFDFPDELAEYDEEEYELVRYEFPIRKDVVALVSVPANLTEREAVRLAKFIQTLPL